MSVIRDFQVNGLNPSIVGGLGTTVKYFPRILGTAGPNGGQSVAPSSSSAAGQLTVPGNNELNGQWFNILLGASVVAGAGAASETAELALYANTGTVTSPSYTKIATTGAVTINPIADGVPVNTALNVSLFGDSNSGLVRGIQTGIKADGTLLTPAALTANLSGINMAAIPPFGLVAGITFSVGAAGNSASLFQFQAVAE
jgi:hypothetical protein